MNSSHESPQGSNPYSTPQSSLGRDGDTAPMANLAQRFGGAMVDGILMWACLLAPPMIAGNLGVMWDALESGDPEVMAQVLGGGDYTATPILIVVLAGFNLWLLFKDGQTIGKRLMGIRIVRTSGVRAGFLRIIALRAWVPGLLYMLPFAGPAIMIIGHAAILLPQRRCLHDFLADTKVVRA